MVPDTREIWTCPSSRGWRSTSRVAFWNSGSSSRKRTPWCARRSRRALERCRRPGPGQRWCGGGPEGPPGQQWVAAVRHAADRPQLGGLQGLLPGQVREDGGQALGQHTLPRPGGPTISTWCRRRRRSPGPVWPAPGPSRRRNRALLPPSPTAPPLRRGIWVHQDRCSTS